MGKRGNRASSAGRVILGAAKNDTLLGRCKNLPLSALAVALDY